MSWILSNKHHYSYFTNTVDDDESIHYPARDIFYRESANAIDICFKFDRATMIRMQKDEILNRDGVPFDDNDALIEWLDAYTGGDISIDVNIQDNPNPAIVVKASSVKAISDITVEASINDYTITVTDATGFIAGHLATIFNTTLNSVYFGRILAINVNVLTLDTPIDSVFPIGSQVTSGQTNMNVDGSVTPVVYGTRNPSFGSDIPLIFDVTRLMFHFQCSSSLDLSKFGDIAGGITRGLVCRFKDGSYRNLFNVKTNGEFKNMMYDFDIESAVGNQQDGATGRFTITNLGVVIRLFENEDLEFIVQDDLTDLEILEIIVEGSEATEV